MFTAVSNQWSIQAHWCMHVEESAWSFLIIQRRPHGRQMAHLIFQTDVPFWDLIWWLQSLCVCVGSCMVSNPKLNKINTSIEVPCCDVCVCAHVWLCDLWAFWCPLFYSFGCSVSLLLSLCFPVDQWLTRTTLTSLYFRTLSFLFIVSNIFRWWVGGFEYFFHLFLGSKPGGGAKAGWKITFIIKFKGSYILNDLST